MRDRILREAARLFRVRGAHGTSTAAIAEAAGVTAPALYWYFESKEALLYSLLLAAWEDFSVAVSAGVAAGKTPTDRLYLTALHHTTWQLEHASGEADVAFTQLVESLKPDWRAELREAQRGFVAQVRSLLVAGAACGQFDVPAPSLTARAIVNVCEYSPQWYRPHGPLTIEEAAAEHASLVLRMAGATPAAPLPR